jgi:hypothetical protein
VLHEFLTANRAIIIDRCRVTVAARSEPRTTDYELIHGIPIFLDQLIATLVVEQATDFLQPMAGEAGIGRSSEIGDMATLHGRDLLARGFTLDQVVHDYGDVCQAVTNLAYETGASIAVDEFRTFNRCLDNAIAGAVTEYAFQQTASATEEGFKALNSRLGPLAHELRNYLHVAMHAVKALKGGTVGLSGAQNAFKFTKRDTEVRLHAHVAADRILIDIEDHCGGLPSGPPEALLLPYAQSGGNRSGLGLGLDISRRGVEANRGALKVRDVPGSGCVFTIDLPRHVEV